MKHHKTCIEIVKKKMEVAKIGSETNVLDGK